MNQQDATEHPVIGTGAGAGARGSILSIGIEANGLRGCLLENISGQHRLAAWHVVPRYTHSPLDEQVANLCRRMGARLGRNLWDEQRQTPFLQSHEPARFPIIEHMTLTASPLPRLRVWLAGLTSSHSIAAAATAVNASPAQIMGAWSLSTEIRVEQMVADLQRTAPHLLIIAGGYDIQDAQSHGPLLLLCTLVEQAITRLDERSRPAILYAGNRWAAQEIETRLQRATGIHVQHIANTMPTPTVNQLAVLSQRLTAEYLERCSHIPGFDRMKSWLQGLDQVATVESNFTRLVHVWMELHNLGELYGLYCGEHHWLHVHASRAEQGLQMIYAEPNTRPVRLQSWPPLRLVSGRWSGRFDIPAEVQWWDRSGIGPLIAPVGQFAPSAMMQVLRHDVFR